VADKVPLRRIRILQRQDETMDAVYFLNGGVAPIACRHGRLTILQRQKLEAASCECYAVLRIAVEELSAF
jgi:hypothetical protein